MSRILEKKSTLKEKELEEAAKNDESNSQKKVNNSTSKIIPEFSNKINYEKLPKDELIQRLKESDDKMKMEYEERKKLLKAKKSEIDEKDQIINSFAKANKKLLSEFDSLKYEVDKRLDKVNIKTIQKIEKINEDKKNNPLEIVLKVKERELKNTFQMMQIVKRDKEILQKQLEEKTDYKRVVSLEDSLSNEEKKNQSLQMENKVLQKMLEDHNKKCLVRVNQNNEKEKTSREELKTLKDKNREYLHKQKEEEDKHNETKQKYQELRRDYDKIKNLIPKEVEEKEKEKAEKEKMHRVNRSVNLGHSDKLRDRSGSPRSPKSSKSKNRKKLYNTNEENKLFNIDDMKKLTKILNKS